MRVLRFLCDTAVDLCLGCRHDRITRPFTIADESYMVCLDCGRQLFYSLDDMRRLSSRELRRLRAARAASPGVVTAAGERALPTVAATLSLVPRSADTDRAA